MKITKQLLTEMIEEEIRGIISEGNWGQFATSVYMACEDAIYKALESKGIDAFTILSRKTKIEKQEYGDGEIWKTLYIPVRFKDIGPNP